MTKRWKWQVLAPTDYSIGLDDGQLWQPPLSNQIAEVDADSFSDKYILGYIESAFLCLKFRDEGLSLADTRSQHILGKTRIFTCLNEGF